MVCKPIMWLTAIYSRWRYGRGSMSLVDLVCSVVSCAPQTEYKAQSVMLGWRLIVYRMMNSSHCHAILSLTERYRVTLGLSVRTNFLWLVVVWTVCYSATILIIYLFNFFTPSSFQSSDISWSLIVNGMQNLITSEVRIFLLSVSNFRKTTAFYTIT